MPYTRKRMTWIILIILLNSTALGISGVIYTNRVADKRAQEICGVVTLIDDRNQSITPANEDQHKFFDALHRYRQGLHCP